MGYREADQNGKNATIEQAKHFQSLKEDKGMLNLEKELLKQGRFIRPNTTSTNTTPSITIPADNPDSKIS